MMILLKILRVKLFYLQMLNVISNWLIALNSAINFFIYCLAGAKFRQVTKLSQGCPQVVSKLSLSCLQVVTKLSHNCPQVVPKLSPNCLEIIKAHLLPLWRQDQTGNKLPPREVERKERTKIANLIILSGVCLKFNLVTLNQANGGLWTVFVPLFTFEKYNQYEYNKLFFRVYG